MLSQLDSGAYVELNASQFDEEHTTHFQSLWQYLKIVDNALGHYLSDHVLSDTSLVSRSPPEEPSQASVEEVLRIAAQLRLRHVLGVLVHRVDMPVRDEDVFVLPVNEESRHKIEGWTSDLDLSTSPCLSLGPSLVKVDKYVVATHAWLQEHVSVPYKRLQLYRLDARREMRKRAATAFGGVEPDRRHSLQERQAVVWATFGLMSIASIVLAVVALMGSFWVGTTDKWVVPSIDNAPTVRVDVHLGLIKFCVEDDTTVGSWRCSHYGKRVVHTHVVVPDPATGHSVTQSITYSYEIDKPDDMEVVFDLLIVSMVFAASAMFFAILAAINLNRQEKRLEYTMVLFQVLNIAMLVAALMTVWGWSTEPEELERAKCFRRADTREAPPESECLDGATLVTGESFFSACFATLCAAFPLLMSAGYSVYRYVHGENAGTPKRYALHRDL